jgi:hypothetical protein
MELVGWPWAGRRRELPGPQDINSHRNGGQMRLRKVIAASSIVFLAGCGGNDDNEASDSAPEYPPFSEVDPETSLFFIELEDTDLVETQGEERLYNLGIDVCEGFDADRTVEQILADDASLGDVWGQVVALAVTDLCPQYGDEVDKYVAANP